MLSSVFVMIEAVILFMIQRDAFCIPLFVGKIQRSASEETLLENGVMPICRL